MEIRMFREEDAAEVEQVIAKTASLTAVEFYRKMGYDYKNGIAAIDDEEQVYRLEK